MSDAVAKKIISASYAFFPRKVIYHLNFHYEELRGSGTVAAGNTPNACHIQTAPEVGSHATGVDRDGVEVGGAEGARKQVGRLAPSTDSAEKLVRDDDDGGCVTHVAVDVADFAAQTVRSLTVTVAGP